MIIFKEGNLFDYTHEALAHGVNSKGKMGAGIATEFKKQFPQMYSQYKKKCLSGELKPGELFFYDSGKGPVVFNLVTQASLGRAKQSFLEKAAEKMYIKAVEEGITDIAMPQIGTGRGKLTLDDLKNVLYPLFDSSDMHVTIYSLSYQQQFIRNSF